MWKGEERQDREINTLGRCTLTGGFITVVLFSSAGENDANVFNLPFLLMAHLPPVLFFRKAKMLCSEKEGGAGFFAWKGEKKRGGG